MTLTAPVTDLEEMLEDFVPCGGNNFPVRHSCTREATWIRRESICTCVPMKRFKCDQCYEEWLTAATSIGRPGAKWTNCPVCFTAYFADPRDMYRRL